MGAYLFGDVGGSKAEDHGGRGRLRVIFIRHGESENNILCRVSFDHYKKYRKPDPKLSKLGEAQALAAADYFEKNPPVVSPISQILVSPMTRALMTAKPIAEKLKLAPVVWADLYEVGGCFGGQEGNFWGDGGLKRSDMKTQFPKFKLPSNITEKGWYPRGLKKESTEHGQRRAAALAERLRDMAMGVEGDKNVLVVAHFDTIDLLMRNLLEINADVKDTHPGVVCQHYNAALSCIDIDSKATRPAKLLFANRADHLPYDLVDWENLGIV